jgi:hypothetical protein
MKNEEFMKPKISRQARLEAARKAADRLHAKIVGRRLIISIGVETLALAAEECDGNPKVKILDAKQLALDVIAELESEDEVGASKLTDLLDKAVYAAMENGSVAFADCDNCKSCREPITKGATECPHCLATDVEN